VGTLLSLGAVSQGQLGRVAVALTRPDDSVGELLLLAGGGPRQRGRVAAVGGRRALRQPADATGDGATG